MRICSQSKTLCLEWDCATTSEGVKKYRWIIARGFEYLASCDVQQVLIIDIFPLYQFGKDSK